MGAVSGKLEFKNTIQKKGGNFNKNKTQQKLYIKKRFNKRIEIGLFVRDF